MLGHVEAGALAGRRRRRDPREVRLDQGLDGGLVEVADGDHRHQVGAVPVLVELPQALGREGADAVRRADRQALGVARALEQHRQLGLQETRVGAEAEAPLLQHHAALLVDLVGLESDAAGPVLEHEERSIDDVGVVGRDLQLEDGLVEAGVGVDVRAEAHPGRLQERDDVLLGEVLRPVERHVLDDVGQATLIGVLEHRARVDDEPQLGASLRLGVAADVVAHPVRQRADRDPRVDGNGIGERRVGRGRLHRRQLFLRGQHRRSGRHDGSRQPQGPNQSQKLHPPMIAGPGKGGAGPGTSRGPRPGRGVRRRRPCAAWPWWPRGRAGRSPRAASPPGCAGRSSRGRRRPGSRSPSAPGRNRRGR